MKRRPKYQESDFPEPGVVFVATLDDGRLTAGRILRREHEGGAMAALVSGSAWIGTTPPPLDLPELRATLQLTHHGWATNTFGGSNQSLQWCWDLMPDEFTIVGRHDLTRAERSTGCQTYGSWRSVPLQAFLQWRWDHDRDNLLCEEAEEAAREAERRRIAKERRDEFMRSLTLEKLAGTRWFESWDEERDTTRQTRERIAQLIEALRQAPKLTLGAVKKQVRAAVKDFNALDKKQEFIDTLEREDLCEAFEQIACAAGQPAVAGEIDEWREW